MAAPNQKFIDSDYEELLKWDYIYSRDKIRSKKKTKKYTFIKDNGTWSISKDIITTEMLQDLAKNMKRKKNSISTFLNEYNSCFVGAAISSVFVAISPLKEQLLHSSHYEQCTENKFFCFAKDVEDLIKDIVKGQRVHHDGIVNHLPFLLPEYKCGRHEDCMSFLVVLLERMRAEYEECKSIPNPINPFYGVQSEMVKCCNCFEEKPEKMVPFNHIVAFVKGHKNVTQILTDYQENEVLEPTYSCNLCGSENVAVFREIVILQYPSYFVLQCKYNEDDIESGLVSVEYSASLDIKKVPEKQESNNHNNSDYKNDDDEDDKCIHYDLYGIIEREADGRNFGHFWAIIKQNKNFFCCNDAISVRISQYEAFDADTPYALIYVKRGFVFGLDPMQSTKHEATGVPLIPNDTTNIMDDDDNKSDSWIFEEDEDTKQESDDEYFPFQDMKKKKSAKSKNKKKNQNDNKMVNKSTTKKTKAKQQKKLKVGDVTTDHTKAVSLQLKAMKTNVAKENYINDYYSLPSLKKLINKLDEIGNCEFKLNIKTEKDKKKLVKLAIEKFNL